MFNSNRAQYSIAHPILIISLPQKLRLVSRNFEAFKNRSDAYLVPFGLLFMLPENIVITEDPAPSLSSFLAKKSYSKILALTDEHTVSQCYPLVREALPAHQQFTVKSGEEHKTLLTCEAIWQAMTDAQLDRHSVVVIIGGGVLGDMGGFCAATYKRGIDFILVPTTLLAQADASIGG
jgi:3-dehydroquinate synthase